MVDAAIVRGQGRDHLVLLHALALLLQQLLLEVLAALQLYGLDPALRLLAGHAGHCGHVHAEAQRAQAAGLVGELHLGGLEVAREARRVRHVLDEDVGLVHGQSLLVVLHEVGRRDRVEDLCVGQADHILRRTFVGVLGEGLVAGEIDPRRGILGEHHGGHVGEQMVHPGVLLPQPRQRVIAGHSDTSIVYLINVII